MFCTEAIERLSYEFPSTLGKFDGIDHYSRVQECVPLHKELFSVVELGRKFNVPKVLPWAFFASCAYVPFNQIMETDAAKPHSSHEDQRICILGWRKLIESQVEVTYAWLAPKFVYTNCQAPVQCGSRREVLLRDLFLPVPTCIALEVWDSKWESGMCASCKTTAKNSHNAGRRKLWQTLPSFFELPKWPELLKQ